MGERVIVCGGRDYDDRAVVFEFLDLRHKETPFDLLMHGGADGADSLANEWAVDREVPFKIFRANWYAHGKAAGPLRNQQMLEEGRPTVVVSFPGGRGTADMVRRALKAGLPVWSPIPALKTFPTVHGEGG